MVMPDIYTTISYCIIQPTTHLPPTCPTKLDTYLEEKISTLKLQGPFTFTNVISTPISYNELHSGTTLYDGPFDSLLTPGITCTNFIVTLYLRYAKRPLNSCEYLLSQADDKNLCLPT